MTVHITREQARAWKERWRLVREREIQELRETPMEVKAAQTAAMMAMAPYFPETEQERIEREEMRERWAELRRRYGR